MIDGIKKKSTKKNTTQALPKKNNATSGNKAHNDNQHYKVGRIRFNSWATQALQSCDIVVFERELVHIFNRHKKELSTMGLSAYDYIKLIIDNFNEVYEAKLGRMMLVMKRESISHYAVVELSYRNNVYEIKTAVMIESKRLSKMKLLCANARRK